MSNTKLEKIKDAEAKLTTKIEESVWLQAQKDAFKKLSRKVEIKGFRKGQAPEAMVRKMISSQQILIEAAESVAQDALIKGIEENDVQLIDKPSLSIEKIDEKECVLSFVCPVKPDVELCDYSSIKYEVKKVSVKAEDVEKELKSIQESKAELELKEDGTVEKGDTAVIDFEGFKDGVAFEGGKGDNYDLVIGSGSFIPGFEDQLIGMKPEEEREIDVTFPDDYQAENLKGQAAKFKVKVHEIKKKVLPEITEDLIAELKIEGVKTLDELKAHIKETLKKNKEIEAENKATEEVLNKLCDGSKVEIPEVMIKDEQENMFNDYANRMMAQGIDMNTYLKITGATKEAFLDMMKEDAKKKVKINLVLEEIAKKEKLDAKKDEIEKEFSDLAERYSMKVEEIKKYISDAQLKSDIVLRKALDFVKKTKDAK